MATSSILKEVRVKGRAFSRNFVRALEKAESMASKDVVYTQRVQELKGDCIKKMFNQNTGE